MLVYYVCANIGILIREKLYVSLVVIIEVLISKNELELISFLKALYKYVQICTFIESIFGNLSTVF